MFFSDCISQGKGCRLAVLRQAGKLPKQERCQLAAAAQAAAKRSAASAIRSSSPKWRKKQCKISLADLPFLYFKKKKLGELLVGNERLLKPPQRVLLLKPSGRLHRNFTPVTLKQYKFSCIFVLSASQKGIFRERCQLAAA